MEKTSADAGVSTLTLAGREWALPMLAPRQNRVVVPALLALVPKILKARDDADKAGEKGSFAALARYLNTESYDTLATLVFAALTRGHPELDRECFDDMAIGTFELAAAVVPIARAAGLLKPKMVSSPARSLGESLPRTGCGVPPSGPRSARPEDKLRGGGGA